MRYEKLYGINALALDGSVLKFQVGDEVFEHINEDDFPGLVNGIVVEILDDAINNGYFSVHFNEKETEQPFSFDIPKCALKLIMIDLLEGHHEEGGQVEGGELSGDSGGNEEDSG
jgi:hypothetical protein